MARILVIDDDPLFRTLTSRAAGLIADEIATAADGHEGYQTALKFQPDIVILDLLMPTWDGVQTLRAFRSDKFLSSVPVLIVSGSLESEELYTACELGVSGVMAKSEFSRDALVAVVEKLLRDLHQSAVDDVRTPVDDGRRNALPVSAQRFDS